MLCYANCDVLIPFGDDLRELCGSLPFTKANYSLLRPSILHLIIRLSMASPVQLYQYRPLLTNYTDISPNQLCIAVFLSYPYMCMVTAINLHYSIITQLVTHLLIFLAWSMF